MAYFNVKAILRTDKQRKDTTCPVYILASIKGKSIKLPSDMMEKHKKSSSSFIIAIKNLLEPLQARLEGIDKVLKGKERIPKYYRNEDLKLIFGLSNNTIIKYRRTGILPYTKIGDIFLYDTVEIDKILRDNRS